MAVDRPLRYSIRGRAAFLTSVLVAVALAAFTWLTVARVRADLIRRGIERAETTAATLAPQTSQGTQQGLNRLSQVASGPAVLNFLRDPNDQTRAALLAAARSGWLGDDGADSVAASLASWRRAGNRPHGPCDIGGSGTLQGGGLSGTSGQAR